MAAGEEVEVLAFEDLNGNPEWWQCRNKKGKEGKLEECDLRRRLLTVCLVFSAQGFVAANYLQQLEEGESMKGSAVVEEEDEDEDEDEPEAAAAAPDVVCYAQLGFDYEADSDFEVAVRWGCGREVAVVDSPIPLSPPVQEGREGGCAGSQRPQRQPGLVGGAQGRRLAGLCGGSLPRGAVVREGHTR